MLLSGLPEPAKPPGPGRRIGHELREGAAFVLGHPLLRPILVTAVFFNTSWFILQAVYVAYAVQELKLTAAGVGATLGTYGLGMVVGAALASRLARHVSFGATIAIGPLGGLAAALLMVSTIRYPSGILAGASFFLFGAGPILWTISTTRLRQAITPNAMLGRVSALILTASFGARPVGAAIGGVVADRFGVDASLAAAAAGFALQFLVLFASPVPRLARLPEPA